MNVIYYFFILFVMPENNFTQLQVCVSLLTMDELFIAVGS